MKKRYGFVSNSSSSSFLILKRYLSEDQLEKIRNHSISGRQYASEWPWTVTEDEDKIEAFTIMDNFDFLEYLEEIGVPKKRIATRW
jgi:hypothetical protein